MCSFRNDEELQDWFCWQQEHECRFIRALIRAVEIANLQAYNLLRPALLQLKEKYPQEG